MVLTAIAVWIMNITSNKPYYLVLAGEIIGVWAFSSYWVLKAREMKELDAKLSNKA